MKHKTYSKPSIVVKVAEFTPVPGNGWYLCQDGNIWYANTRLLSNEGTPTEFMRFTDNNRLRWVNGYPDKFTR